MEGLIVAGEDNSADFEIVVRRPGTRLLQIERGSSVTPFVTIAFEEGAGWKRMAIPALARTSYIFTTKHPTRLRVRLPKGSTFRLSRMGPGALLAAWLSRRHRDYLHVALPNGGGLTPLLQLNGSEGRALVKTLRLLAAFGLTAHSPHLAAALMPLQQGGALKEQAASGKRMARDTKPLFAVVLHLYYLDLWPEFEFCLKRLTQRFHLIVTVVRDDEAFVREVKSAFPDADIVTYPNRGRDVGPFVQLLRDGGLDRFDLVCKLHGKKSGVGVAQAFFGDIWRRTNILDLVGDDRQVDRIVARFDENPGIGMVGSSHFRVPRPGMPEQVCWGTSKTETLLLAERLGVSSDRFKLDFFAGTMFWARRSVLEPLRSLGLTLDAFPEEDGALDGHIHHALERLLGALPAVQGLALEDLAYDFEALQSDEDGVSPFPHSQMT